jgi:hypothetical protein
MDRDADAPMPTRRSCLTTQAWESAIACARRIRREQALDPARLRGLSRQLDASAATIAAAQKARPPAPFQENQPQPRIRRQAVMTAGEASYHAEIAALRAPSAGHQSVPRTVPAWRH